MRGNLFKTILVLCLCTSLCGCGSKPDTEMRNVQKIPDAATQSVTAVSGMNGDSASKKLENCVPPSLHETVGKVVFDCNIKAPKDLSRVPRLKQISEIDMESYFGPAAEKLVQGFKEEGKALDQEMSEKAACYYFSDNSLISNDRTAFMTVFDDAQMTRYTKVGALQADADQYFPYVRQENTVNFLTEEGCKKLVEGLENRYGFHLNSFDLTYAPVSHIYLQKLEEARRDAGIPGETIGNWTESDDAWFVYGFQTVNDIPVMTELMHELDGGRFEYSYAVLQMVFTRKGPAFLYISPFYQITSDTKFYDLTSFEKCRQTIADAYNRLLTDGKYKVTNIVFCYMIQKTKDNKGLEAIPVWNFMIDEQSEDTGGMMKKVGRSVNAETGKEVFSPRSM